MKNICKANSTRFFFKRINMKPTVDYEFSEEKGRKSLHILQSASTGKENLVNGKKVLRSTNQPFKPINENVISLEKKFKGIKKSTKIADSKKLKKKIEINVNDLTSESDPGENYWKILSETRRKTINDTLRKNRELKERVKKLLDENTIFKQMLDKSQVLVDILREIICDDQPDSANNSFD